MKYGIPSASLDDLKRALRYELTNSKRTTVVKALERAIKQREKQLSPLMVAWHTFKTKNPQIFDCTTLEMHPAHHRYLENRLREAFESGWDAKKI